MADIRVGLPRSHVWLRDAVQRAALVERITPSAMARIALETGLQALGHGPSGSRSTNDNMEQHRHANR